MMAVTALRTIPTLDSPLLGQLPLPFPDLSPVVPARSSATTCPDRRSSARRRGTSCRRWSRCLPGNDRPSAGGMDVHRRVRPTDPTAHGSRGPVAAGRHPTIGPSSPDRVGSRVASRPATCRAGRPIRPPWPVTSHCRAAGTATEPPRRHPVAVYRSRRGVERTELQSLKSDVTEPSSNTAAVAWASSGAIDSTVSLSKRL